MTGRDRTPKRFDMPSQRLDHHYSVPKATDPEIAALLKSQGEKSGTFFAQRLGMVMVQEMIRKPYKDAESELYVRTRASEMMYNSASHSFDPFSKELNMHWDLTLPVLAEDRGEDKFRQTTDGLMYLARQDINVAAVRATDMLVVLGIKDKDRWEKEVLERGRDFARVAGNGALKLASLGVTADYGNKTAKEIQREVLIISGDLDKRARDAHENAGVDITLALLATGDPDVAFPGAPKEAMSAYETARVKYTQ